jgi:dihydropteroate synthase
MNNRIFRSAELTHAPMIMGILNVTEDSFYEGSKVSEKSVAVRAACMLEQGAGILDLGGQSTRPGARVYDADTEADRVIPAIVMLRREFPEAILSVDTFYASVAEKALDAGCNVVNDVTGFGFDPALFELLVKRKPAYVLTHNHSVPGKVCNNVTYNDITQQILLYFSEKLLALHSAGVHDLALDPGFGFSKETAENFEVLKQLKRFTVFDIPVLAGVSRKSMIWKTLDIHQDEALNGTSTLHMAALMNGARILRVHDVREAVECVKLFGFINPNTL